MADTPLLAAVDDDEGDGTERFAVVIVDFAAGQVRSLSRAMLAADATEYFEALGEDADTIAKRFQSARTHKGRV